MVESIKPRHNQIIKNKKTANKMRRERSERWQAETKSNVLLKLKKAKELFDGGNSMSKSARLANIEYQIFKDFITTDKFKVED